MTNHAAGIRDTLNAPEAIPVRLLSRAVLGRLGEGRCVAVLSAYFDGGGSIADPKCAVFSMAGYVADDATWGSFERDWSEALRAYELTAFHAKDFAHSRGEFSAWKKDEKRRAAFMQRLTDVIREHRIEGSSATLDLRAFREVNKHVRFAETIGAYSITALTVWGRLDDWRRRFRPDDRIIYIFEDGDAGQGQFKQWLRHKNKAAKEGMEPLFLKKDTVVPLQAADFLAYETHKMMTDFLMFKKSVVRESMFRLAYREIVPPTEPHFVLTAAFLLNMVRMWRVPKRTR